MTIEKYERIIHLMREIEFAKSQLQPHDTGHISTAISWMQGRVRTLESEIRGSYSRSPDLQSVFDSKM